jgi:hypothetical protein
MCKKLCPSGDQAGMGGKLAGPRHFNQSPESFQASIKLSLLPLKATKIPASDIKKAR